MTLVLDNADIERLLTVEACLDALEVAFSGRLGQGRPSPDGLTTGASRGRGQRDPAAGRAAARSGRTHSAAAA